jgi:hypothetical protein
MKKLFDKIQASIDDKKIKKANKSRESAADLISKARKSLREANDSYEAVDSDLKDRQEALKNRRSFISDNIKNNKAALDLINKAEL